MNILVTGGSGFLGSHVADALSANGHRVALFDKRSSPYLREDQRMVIGDITSVDDVNMAVKGMDIVYHFAGIMDIGACIESPLNSAHVNIIGTVNLLNACRSIDCKRFVFASSSYVYSRFGSCYRTSKVACELYIEDFYEIFKLPYTILRYGSLYGDRADYRNGIYRFIKQAIDHRKITFNGTGNELREYIHVRDAARLSAEILNPEFENERIILTGTEKFKIKDLLDMLNEMLGGEISIVFSNNNMDHYTITPYNFNPKLGRKLINNPHIDIGQGLLNCIEEIYKDCNSESY